MRASVRVTYGPAELRIEIVDDGAPAGRRLLGLRERVAVYGGELKAARGAERRRLARGGPAPGGGERVRRLRRVDPRVFDWALALLFAGWATISAYTTDHLVGPAWLTALVAGVELRRGRLRPPHAPARRRSRSGRPA